MTTFPPGTLIETPTGKRGVVAIPDGNPSLPLHCLILFPDGTKSWFLAEILTPIASVSKRRSRSNTAKVPPKR